jgi:hypothetical protein
MQTIKYKDTEFQIRDNNLLIKESAVPLLVKFRKLQAEYLDDMDNSIIDEYEKTIKQYETVISQIENDETQTEYLETIKKKLVDTKELYVNDEQVKIIRSAREEIMGLMLMQLCYDKPMILKLFNKLLIGNLNIIDWDSEESLIFSLEAVTRFFTIAKLSKGL